jgi:uncharacterized protein (TIGR04255 family)
MNISLPKKLQKDIILSAVFELRFSTKLPSEAVYGVVYQIVAKKYPSFHPIKLPITQLPEVIRNSDPNFLFQPHNILEIDTRGIGIGPRVLTFSVKKPYIGWGRWASFIAEFVPCFVKSGVLGTIERVGLRFINFTEKNLCEVAKMNVQIGDEQIECQPMTLRTEIQGDGNTKIVQLINNAVIDFDLSKRLTGSVIDIEVFEKISLSSTDFQGQFQTILNEFHNTEKKPFLKFCSRIF